jgi:hydrogenase nickel incorporation protein HypB
MFSVCNVMLVNKIDYLDGSDFNLELLRRRAHELNPPLQIFEASCKTGEGLDEWSRWLLEKVKATISC